MDPTNLPKRYRAIIVHDDPMFSYTHRAVVQEACEVIAETDNGLAALQAAEALQLEVDCSEEVAVALSPSWIGSTRDDIVGPPTAHLR